MREWLKDLRKSLGMTQAEMAGEIGCTVANYSLIESGKRQTRMELPLVWKIAHATEKPVGTIAEMEMALEVESCTF